MFHQITKKIIALVTTVCLLVGVMVVPSSAAGIPVSYLYNGVEFSALPAWDDEVYPYVFIARTWLGGYDAVATSSPAWVYLKDNGDYVIDWDNPSIRASYSHPLWDDWKDNGQFTNIALGDDVFLWSNYDIYNDGVLYLAASDPVPVIDDIEGGESILEVLNSILDYDVATFNLLTYGTNRIRYIERYVASILEAITPSEEETALKEATSDVTSAYAETFWSDSGGGFGRSGIEDAGIVFQHSKKMFDTGVSVSDFFGLFDAYGWGNWFSAETRDDLDTVPTPAVIDDEEDLELSTYEKNLQEIQSFVGGG